MSRINTGTLRRTHLSDGLLFRSPIDLSANECGHIVSMVQRVHRIAFIDSGVVQDVIDVESGMMNIALSDKAKKGSGCIRR